MGTLTAQILVGQKHPYEGGITNISHMLYLSENSRPVWILTPSVLFEEDVKSLPRRIRWIPTKEHMLEDALLMIGLYVLKDKYLIKAAKQYFANDRKDFIELYKDIQSEHLQKLYEYIKTITSNHKIMVSVFDRSYINKQLPILKAYQQDIEVCKSVYRKELSPWSGEFESRGELE